MRREQVSFEELFGKTLTDVQVNKDDDEIIFVTEDGSFVMYHEQDCCESVTIEDIVGSAGLGFSALVALIGEEILLAEEVDNAGDDSDGGGDYESHTWTFYKLSTMSNHVTIRWYGESNGYYSEVVNFARLDDSL